MHKRKTMKNIIRYAIFLLTASIAFAQGNSKLARDLDGFHPGEKVDVIVQFHQAPTEKDFHKVRGQSGELKKCLHAVKGA